MVSARTAARPGTSSSRSERRRLARAPAASGGRTGGAAAAAAADELSKPKWAGDDLLSKVVNAAIATPVLYEPMKVMARKTLIDTAEKKGIAWRDESKALEQDASVQAAFAEVRDEAVEGDYPGYYLQPFHAYSEGNLCWQAACEAESATYSMALRVWPDEAKAGLTWEAAQARLRDSYVGAIADHLEANGLPAPKALGDFGCSVGISTRALQAAWPGAEVTGLDLSPYMLAVAKARAEAEGRSVRWLHGKAEATGLPDGSFDLVSLAFVLHECPQDASRAIIAEAVRLLRPGGTLVMTDNNPKSPVIQKLPPVLFTLMKSTEPHSDEYYTFDVEAAFREAGLSAVHTEPTDPRHRTVLGSKLA